MPEASTLGPIEPNARERLLAAAVYLFAQKGYTATTVREIVAAANVTKPVLYYYFKNKEGVYQELMNQALSDFHRVLQLASLAGSSPWRRITNLCEAVYRQFQEHLEFSRMMNAIFYGPPHGAPLFDCQQFVSGIETTVKNLLTEGIDSKAFRQQDPHAAAQVILAVTQGAMQLELYHPETSRGFDGFQEMLHVVYQGIGNDEKESHAAHEGGIR